MSSAYFKPRFRSSKTTTDDWFRNPGLSHEQRAQATGILQEIDEDLLDYATEIRSTQNRLASLISDKTRLEIARSNISSLLSPIHKLPNELLANIFYLASWESTTHRTDPIFHIRAVCSRWNSVALSFPSLWSCFYVNICDPDDYDEAKNDVLDARLDMYLERSKSHPLTLRIDVGMPWTDDDHPVFMDHPLLVKVTGSASRWANVILDVSLPLSSAFYHTLCGLDLPLLETVVISTCYLDDPSEIDSFSRAPNLFSLSAYWCTWKPTTMPLLNQLTRLEYEPRFESFFRLLECCQKLQYLAVLPSDFDSDDLDIDYTPRQTSITTFHVHFHEGLVKGHNTVQLSLDSVTSPLLTTLILESSDFCSSLMSPRADLNAGKSIDSLLRRSGCALTILRLRDVSISDKDLVTLLKRLSSLVELSVEDPKPNDPKSQSPIRLPLSKPFIESLHSFQPSSLRSSIYPFVPKLRYLTLNIKSKGFDVVTFIGVVSSRWTDPRVENWLVSEPNMNLSCLRSIELHLVDQVNSGDYMPLLLLAEQGLRVVVKGVDSNGKEMVL